MCDINAVQFTANISIAGNVICKGRIIVTKRETYFILWQQERLCRLEEFSLVTVLFLYKVGIELSTCPVTYVSSILIAN